MARTHNSPKGHAGSGTRQRIFIFDSPTTCSTLLCSLFSGPPQIAQLLSPFEQATTYQTEYRISRGRDDFAPVHLAPVQRTTKPSSDRRMSHDLATRRLLNWIVQVEARGQVPWIKEQTLLTLQHQVLLDTAREKLPALPSNPTFLPDEIFFTFTPILLIRHPALLIPAFYRKMQHLYEGPGDKAFALATTNKVTRMIFDVYCENWRGRSRNRKQRPLPPIVIESDDLEMSTGAIVSLLCDRLGFDSLDARIALEYEDDPNTSHCHSMMDSTTHLFSKSRSNEGCGLCEMEKVNSTGLSSCRITLADSCLTGQRQSRSECRIRAVSIRLRVWRGSYADDPGARRSGLAGLRVLAEIQARGLNVRSSERPRF